MRMQFFDNRVRIEESPERLVRKIVQESNGLRESRSDSNCKWSRWECLKCLTLSGCNAGFEVGWEAGIRAEGDERSESPDA